MHPEQNRTKTKQKYSIEPLCVQSQRHIHVHVYARTQQSMRSWRRPRTKNKTQNILNRNTGSDSYTTHKPQRWTQRGRDRITNERRVDEDALHCGQKTCRHPAAYDTQAKRTETSKTATREPTGREERDDREIKIESRVVLTCCTRAFVYSPDFDFDFVDASAPLAPP